MICYRNNNWADRGVSRFSYLKDEDVGRKNQNPMTAPQADITEEKELTTIYEEGKEERDIEEQEIRGLK